MITETRREVMLGSYWYYVAYSGGTYAESIGTRLVTLGFRPSHSEEHVPDTRSEAGEDHELAWETYRRLCGDEEA